MTNIFVTHLKASTGLFVGAGILAVFGFAIIFSVPQAKAAEYPDILTGPDMTVGSTGQNVVELQGLMSELGYLNVPSGIAFGYYGPLTESAVANYQASLKVLPSAGYFGPATKSAMYNSFAEHGWLQLLGWQ